MKVADRFHLTYCSNIHPGESWSAVQQALADALPRVRRLVGVTGPFAIGLRLSAEAAASLDSAAALEAFRAFLRDGDYYVQTINGFPYGAFHGQRVKERVYLPDWRDARRVEYTNRLARLLAALLRDRTGNDRIDGSVSTVPGAFRSNVQSGEDVDRIAANILRHAASLVTLQRDTGVTVTLAIEPEPACFVETMDDAIAFFAHVLFDARRVTAIARDTGVALTVDDVRRHVGVCVDACHMAVEYEDPASAFEALQRAGVRVGKVQVSSALELEDCDSAALHAALAPFVEDTYLHQVVERQKDGLVRYVDLPDALRASAGSAQKRDWRVHFHVPIFLDSLEGAALSGAGAALSRAGLKCRLRTTQPYLASVLALLKRGDICSCLEVETYTWDVLPQQHRTSDVCTAIARELRWAKAALEQ